MCSHLHLSLDVTKHTIITLDTLTLKRECKMRNINTMRHKVLNKNAAIKGFVLVCTP